MFDFDCPDFEQYENEKYEHQVFKFVNLYSNQNEPKLLSLLDLTFKRDYMSIETEANTVSEKDYKNSAGEEHKIKLPFPEISAESKKKFIFRLIFKPETGILWGFNEFTSNAEHYYQPQYKDLLKGNMNDVS